VHELLAREPRERTLQRGLARIAEDQIECGAGGLLLAVRMVDEQLVEVRERALGPRGPGR